MKFYKFMRLWLFFFVMAFSKEDILAPIIVNKDNIVIDGHTRLRIAKRLGMKVPIVVIKSDIVFVDPNSLKESY